MPKITLNTIRPDVQIGADLWLFWMKVAARLAVRGHGNVEPNPMVGCVIVDAKKNMVGWGYHRKIGGAHAEVEALKRAGAKARGATAIVTLEPCAHVGRTPPCVDALKNAGVARVVNCCVSDFKHAPAAWAPFAATREYRFLHSDDREHLSDEEKAQQDPSAQWVGVLKFLGDARAAGTASGGVR